MRYGKLMLMDYVGGRKKFGYFWCDCGVICEKRMKYVYCGDTTSCSCQQKQNQKNSWTNTSPII